MVPVAECWRVTDTTATRMFEFSGERVGWDLVSLVSQLRPVSLVMLRTSVPMVPVAAKERVRWSNWCSWVIKLLMDEHWKCAGRCDSPRTFPYCADPQRGGTGLFLRLLPHPQLHAHLPRRQQMGRGEESVLAGAAGSHFGVDREHIIQRLGWGDYKATHGPLLWGTSCGQHCEIWWCWPPKCTLKYLDIWVWHFFHWVIIDIYVVVG